MVGVGFMIGKKFKALKKFLFSLWDFEFGYNVNLKQGKIGINNNWNIVDNSVQESIMVLFMI